MDLKSTLRRNMKAVKKDIALPDFSTNLHESYYNNMHHALGYCVLRMRETVLSETGKSGHDCEADVR